MQINVNSALCAVLIALVVGMILGAYLAGMSVAVIQLLRTQRAKRAMFRSVKDNMDRMGWTPKD